MRQCSNRHHLTVVQSRIRQCCYSLVLTSRYFAARSFPASRAVLRNREVVLHALRADDIRMRLAGLCARRAAPSCRSTHPSSDDSKETHRPRPSRRPRGTARAEAMYASNQWRRRPLRRDGEVEPGAAPQRRDMRLAVVLHRHHRRHRPGRVAERVNERQASCRPA